MPGNSQLTVLIIAIGAVAVIPLSKRFAIYLAHRRFPGILSIPSPSERVQILKGASRWMALCLSDVARPVIPLLMSFGLLFLPGLGPTRVSPNVAFYSLAIYLLTQAIMILACVSLARQRVARRLREILADRGTAVCRACGYDLRGQSEAVCPECGTSFDEYLLTSSPGFFDNVTDGVIRIQVVYTDEFIRRSFRVHCRATSSLTNFGLVVGIAACAYFIIRFGDSWLTGALGASVVYMILARIRLMRAIKPTIAIWQRFPDRTVTFEFREDDVTARDMQSTSVTKWLCFTRLIEADELVLLYLYERSYYAIPRSLVDEQTLKMLRFKVGKQPALAESATVSDSLAS